MHPRLQAVSATQNVPFGASPVITEAGHRDVPNGGSARLAAPLIAYFL